MFITVLAKALRMSQFWARSIQSTMSQTFFKINFGITDHLRLVLPSGLLPCVFPTNPCIRFSSTPCILRRVHHILLHSILSHNISWGVQIMRPFIMSFSPFFCVFLALKDKYIPEYPCRTSSTYALYHSCQLAYNKINTVTTICYIKSRRKLCDRVRNTWANVYILITNLMHWLLFIHKILFSSTCFEPQVLIFRRIQLYTCSIWYCHISWWPVGTQGELCNDRPPRSLIESDSTICCMYTTVSSWRWALEARNM